MKLVSTISRSYILHSLIIYLVAATGLYLCVDRLTRDETDKQLKRLRKALVAKMQTGPVSSVPPFIETQRSAPGQGETRDRFGDTLIVLREGREGEPFRQLRSGAAVGGESYDIILRTSTIENEDLLSTVALALLAIFTVLVVVLVVLNYRTTRRIFRPFFHNLEILKSFSLRTRADLALEPMDVIEFAELNAVVMDLSRKARQEYTSLQEFTGDVSHELLTPVAVIKSRLEMLLQKENLDQETIDVVQTSYQNLNRLERLNRSLVLMSKLDRDESFDLEDVDASAEVIKIIRGYKDFAAHRGVRLELDITDHVMLHANESLMSVLIGNLFSNAVKHNIEGGRIRVALTPQSLRVENTGRELTLPPEALFQRFSRESKAADSLGLGLAIAKKICDYHGYVIEYAHHEGIHEVVVFFTPPR